MLHSLPAYCAVTLTVLSQGALLNPFSLVQECLGPRVCRHLKHAICCAILVAILVIGAPIFNAAIPFFKYGARCFPCAGVCDPFARAVCMLLSPRSVIICLSRSWALALPQPANWAFLGFLVGLVCCCCVCCCVYVRRKRRQFRRATGREPPSSDSEADGEEGQEQGNKPKGA